MIYICNFYAHKKEAISNQMEMLRNSVDGYLFAAGIFLNQQHLVYEDISQKRIISSEQEYANLLPRFVRSLPENEAIHYFSEEPELDKLKIFNAVPNDLYISMYRRPSPDYASFLKEFKNLIKVYVELNSHKKMLYEYGISPDKIIVVSPPSILRRSFSDGEFSGKFLFASWNGGDLNSLQERGLVAILDLLELSPEFSCNILLRDNEIGTYKEMIKKRGLQDRLIFSNIQSSSDLQRAFAETDVVLFLTQKRLTKDIPNSIIDGFALGKPTIMTSTVDFAKTVTDCNLGWVVDPGEVLDAGIIQTSYKEKSRNAFKYSEELTPSNYINAVVAGYSK